MEETKKCESCGTEMIERDGVMVCPNCSPEEKEVESTEAEVADESTESTDEAAA